MADLFYVPAAPPPMEADGEPIPCPRCGRIYERSLPGVPGHVPGASDRLCPPMDQRSKPDRDARARKARRRGR
jgi:hypothetical protein